MYTLKVNLLICWRGSFSAGCNWILLFKKKLFYQQIKGSLLEKKYFA